LWLHTLPNAALPDTPAYSFRQDVIPDGTVIARKAFEVFSKEAANKNETWTQSPDPEHDPTESPTLSLILDARGHRETVDLVSVRESIPAHDESCKIIHSLLHVAM
jgi:hypothetical protein